MKILFLIITMSYFLISSCSNTIEVESNSNNQITLDLSYQTASLTQLKKLNDINTYIEEFLDYRYVKSVVDRWSIIVYVISNKYQLDPMLVTSLITRESSFNPLAESYLGAKGFMQVMWVVWGDELTKKEICNTENDLYNEIKGIDAGCYILRHYIDKYGTRVALQRYFGISSYSYTYADLILNDISRKL